MCSSKKEGFDALDIWHIKACACSAYWAEDRLAAAEYVTDGRCRCGELDIVFHRVWECQLPEVWAARDKAAPKWLVGEAKKEPDDVRFREARLGFVSC